MNNMKWSENIGEAHYQGKEVGMAYFGQKLFWQKSNYCLIGKFTDDSTASDWWLNFYFLKKTDISQYVNRDTKEFKIPFELIESYNPYYLFDNNDKLEVIYTQYFPSETTTASGCFQNCSALKYVDVTKWNTHNVSSFNSVFRNCTSLETINGIEILDMQNATNIGSLFENTPFEYIDLSGWRVSDKLDDFYNTFCNCKNLKEINLQFDTPLYFSTMGNCFSNCTNLETIKFGTAVYKNQDWYSGMGSTFYNCLKLKNVSGKFINIKSREVNLSQCSYLTNESAMVFIDGLAYLTDEEKEKGFTISFSKETFSTLTSEQIKIATDKGWMVPSVGYTLHLTGKFTDDSTEDDWWYKTASQDKISIAKEVDKDSKEFDVKVYVEEPTLQNLFYNNDKLEKIVIEPTFKPTSLIQLFRLCRNLISIDVNKIDTSEVTEMDSCFEWCDKLETLDISTFNFSNCTCLNNFITCCRALVDLKLPDKVDVSKVTNLYSAFSLNAFSSLDLSEWSLDSVEDMSTAFGYNENLVDFKCPKHINPNIKYYSNLFSNCKKIEHIDFKSFNTTIKLPLSTNYNYGYQPKNIFANCDSLKKITVTSMPLYSFNHTFADYPALNDTTVQFDKDYKLVTLEGNFPVYTTETGKQNFYVQHSPLDNESAVMLLKNLEDRGKTSSSIYWTIYFSDETYNTLTQDQIKIATDKGWSVSTYK